jgi:hypothetical protein
MDDITKLEKKILEKEGDIRFFKGRILRIGQELVGLRKRLNELQALPVKQKRSRKQKEFPIKISDNIFLKEPEIFPQSVGGSDYGTRGRVIVKKEAKTLVWYKGHNGWAGIGTTSYYGGALVGFDSKARVTDFSGNYKVGNTLKIALEKEDEKIKEFLGIEFSLKNVWKQGTTMVIEKLEL